MRLPTTFALTMLLTAALLSVVPSSPAAAAGPSVELPQIPSVPVQQESLSARPVDPATSLALQGDQPAGGGGLPGGGTPAATPLAPSATWTVSEQSGDFKWSYPLRVPPVPGDLVPQLALSYQSSAVDGRTSVTNNQPSWIGEGWDLSAGFVERTYGPCLADKEGGTTPPVNGNLCWRSNNATASFPGGGGSLICCDGDGKWRLRSDDGSRVERLTGADNLDNDGEHWKITTVDGVQYFFGSRREAKSAWTVPVFGDDAGEPCHGATYAASRCVQAWRWNLDKVVDANGNMMLLQYQTETNSYAEYPSATAVSYIRGGWLERIEYGLHATAATGTPAAEVFFHTADRCVPGSTCTLDRPQNWPDTPLDNRCATATCADKWSPTFWTTKRLDSVTTRVRRATGMSDVDKWQLQQNYPRPGDGEPGAALWLRSITHTGQSGGTKALPAVTFEGSALPNRVYQGDNLSPLLRYRITGVVSEAGGVISVRYAQPECVPNQTMPLNPESNTLRCFPVTWARPDHAERTDWFHKHVVETITLSDRVSSNIEQLYAYQYLDGAGWHHDTSEFTEKEKRTWNEFRGFQRVRVRVGRSDDPAGPISLSEQRFYRGMDGDTLPGNGRRTATVTDSERVAHPDHDWLQGFELESITFLGDSSTVVSKSITDPVWRGPTATRETLKAYQVHPGTVRTFTTLDGGREPRVTRTVTAYDDRGQVTSVSDEGDTATGEDDLCTTTTYVRNTSAWLLALPSRVQTVSARCGTAPAFPADAVSDSYLSYDGQARGAAPVKGNTTRMEVLDRFDSSTPVYLTEATMAHDVHGRVTRTTDALSRHTTTAYTPATGGPTTKIVVTDALGHPTTTDLEVAFGLPLRVTDVNSRATNTAYDPLGRVTAVWLPGRSRDRDPSFRFAYEIRQNEPSVVTSSRLGPKEVFVSTNEIYDGHLRVRQVQAPAAGGGRLITDTRYDSHGRPYKTTSPYFNNGAVDMNLWRASDVEAPAITEARFDGAGRVTAAIFKGGAVEKWRTTTSYGGDRVHLTPPLGGTPTTNIVDARGRTVELLQHQGSSAADRTRYAYTPDGRLASVTDPAGNAWRYGYDLRGRQVWNDHPDKGEATYTYDAAGQLKTARDARGRVLSFAYDNLGRKLSLRSGGESGRLLAQWTYDTVDDGFGGVVKGKPATATTYDGDGNAYTTSILRYTAMYQPRQTAITIPPSAGVLAGTYDSWTSYNVDGSVAGQSFPGVEGVMATEEVFHTYDDAGRPLTTYGEADGTTAWYVSATDYTRYGEQQRVHLGTGTRRAWLSSYFDPATRRLNRTIVDAELPRPMQADTHYTYDPAGNVTSIADTTPDVPADRQCFRYDYLRRLTEAWTPAGTCDANPDAGDLAGPAPYWQSYTYDLVGNRTSRTDHAAAGDATTRYHYPAAGGDRPHAVSSTTGASTQSFGYDATGNLTTRGSNVLEWDELGRLSEVSSGGETTSYVYDATGQRLIRNERGVSTLYLGGQEIRVVNATGATSVTRYYTHAGATVAVRTAGGLTWVAADHHGTGQVAVDAATLTATKRRFDPFGNARGSRPGSWPDENGFVGGAMDAGTGLTHLGAREYDPALGRFVSVDPILDPGDPQQMNAYAYGNNNPTTMSDPDGLKYFVDVDGRVTAPPAAAAASIKKNTGRDVYREADQKVRRLYGRSNSRGCPPDRDCRSAQQKAADSARAAERKAKRELADLLNSLAEGALFDPENAKEFFDTVGRLAKSLKLPFKSASICFDGEGGFAAGAAVSVCLNVDTKGVTVSGMLEAGYYYGFGASAAVRVRINSKAADKVDVGHSSSATRAVEVELGNIHAGVGIEKHDPFKAGGQVSGFIEVGLGSPLGVNFGSFMSPLDSFNSGYIRTW